MTRQSPIAAAAVKTVLDALCKTEGSVEQRQATAAEATVETPLGLVRVRTALTKPTRRSLLKQPVPRTTFALDGKRIGWDKLHAQLQQL